MSPFLPILLLLPCSLAASTPQHIANPTGLLVLGGKGDSETSVEFWSPPPSERHCTLPSLPRPMSGLTGDSSPAGPVSCLESTCSLLTPSGWEPLGATLHPRTSHTTALTPHGLLLLGGAGSPNTTELMDLQTGQSREGWSLEPARQYHCSIQLSSDLVVLTGGYRTETVVTQHSGLAGERVEGRQLPSLGTGRQVHACGWYSVGEEQVLLVTGGLTAQEGRLATTEVLTYTAAGVGQWREAGQLPSPRMTLRGAKVGEILHVTGGRGQDGVTDQVLAWDGVTETWALAGHLAVARYSHAVTEVSLAAVVDYCEDLNKV